MNTKKLTAAIATTALVVSVPLATLYPGAAVAAQHHATGPAVEVSVGSGEAPRANLCSGPATAQTNGAERAARAAATSRLSGLPEGGAAPRPAADRAARERQGDRQCRASRPGRRDVPAQRPALRRRRPLPLRWGHVARPVRGWWRWPPLGAEDGASPVVLDVRLLGRFVVAQGDLSTGPGPARAPGACASSCSSAPVAASAGTPPAKPCSRP
jgi:hypothetical protein